MLKQLVHNGVIIPPAPEPLGLELRVRGVLVRLTPLQEEMALAWARKRGTPYVEDPVFIANFLGDWSRELGVEPVLTLDEVDWSPCDRVVAEERARKDALSPEERKASAAVRKAEREALKRKYGYAIVNGQRVELGNYMTEPSGIFMGRGQHPLRGRWKAGAQQRDVTLNLSPDAPPLPGDWQIVWQPESLWVARWQDELAGKLKYVWLSDTAPVKQSREELKFDKATKLAHNLEAVTARIQEDLASDDERVRMLATACYLIDALCLRVGDEKDPDEADTVGATTLRPEHLTLKADGEVEFSFLGKDSVAWHKTLRPPEQVLKNLADLIAVARPSGSRGVQGDKPQIFPNIGSHEVNAYLSSILPGLSAKVFRTHHATRAVRGSLEDSGVRRDDPEFRKWQAAALANLEAALLCNHTKQDKSDWATAQQRYQQRADKAGERIARLRGRVEQARERVEVLKEEAAGAEVAAASETQRELVRKRSRQRLARARDDVARQKEMLQRAQEALHKIKAQEDIAGRKRGWNLGTSLKSYIDPRVYHTWGTEVGYDVLGSYYPTLLRRKFAWVKTGAGQSDPQVEALLQRVEVRPCMTTDAQAVLALFRAVEAEEPGLALPQDAEDLAHRYLPALERPWVQGIVALDQNEHAVAFASLGPAAEADDVTTLPLTAVVAAAWNTPTCASVLAEQVWQAVQAYEIQHPGSEPTLVASETLRCAAAFELCQALELGVGAEGDSDDEDDDGKS
ncbi:MAG: DNA topoisomerase I [Chloroflexi bacterium]|nr:DNA topoisomerase I [Chloroflexota bacterium]